MSARSRPRANHNQDADEERRLWKEIKDKAHEVDAMIARSNEIGHEILKTETHQAALLEAGKPVEAPLDRKLEELYRENLKLCEEVQHLIAGASSDMNVLDSINILAGLREASSAEQAFAASAAAPLGQRDRTASSKLAGRERPKKSSGSRGSNSAAVTFANAVQAYNVITPNGDNLNDRFVIDNLALYPGNSLSIFNRWGREVFQATNYQNTWGPDAAVAPGVYYYLLKLPNGTSAKGLVEVVK